MVVDRTQRDCLLCGAGFRGRTFLCRACADRYRGESVPLEVRRRFYAAVDRVYPGWSNTFGEVNLPEALLGYASRLPRDARVLEIGGGGGFTLAALRRLGFTRLAASELTAGASAAIRQRLPGVTPVVADAETLPFRDASFDLLLSSDLIEHLPELEHHLAEAARLLTPGGVYLIKTPNRLAAELYYRLRGIYDAFFWHPSMCSPAELAALLDHHGFATEFLTPRRLTAAQLRKIPPARLRPLAARTPVGWLPRTARPHLEVAATKRP